MVSLLYISGLSYLENPRNTHNQCEESRKVWGQYFHEHGNVIQNICKKSEETKRKAQTGQTGQTPKNTLLLHHAYLHFLASESSLVLEIKTKPQQLDPFQNIYSYFFKNIFIYLPFPPCKQDSSTHASSICRRKQHFTHSSRHTGTAYIQSIF